MFPTLEIIRLLVPIKMQGQHQHGGCGSAASCFSGVCSSESEQLLAQDLSATALGRDYWDHENKEKVL